jgi:uncharacterized membrane protein YdjX (TVP38/TMEM64 family)
LSVTAPASSGQPPQFRFRRVVIRFALFLLLLSVAVIAVLFSPLREQVAPDRLLPWLESIRHRPEAPVIFVVLHMTLAAIGVPLSGLIIAGGAVFGTLNGTALNYVGVLLGASISYAIGRSFGYDFVAHLLGARRVALEALLEQRGFWSLVRLRYVPIPFAVTNYGLSLLGVKYRNFLATTAVAYPPILLVWSYFASTLVRAGTGERVAILRNLTLATLLMALLTFLPPGLAAWRRRRAKPPAPAG